MAEKNKGVDVEVDPFADVDDEEEEEEADVSENGKKSRTRSPLLIRSKLAMDELYKMKQLGSVSRGDADRAIALLQQVIAGRLSPQTSASVKWAVDGSIEAAFAIAHADWMSHR